MRSFGEAGIRQILLLICQEDVCCVKDSKYLKQNNCYLLSDLNSCMSVLREIAIEETKQILITTFDSAAEWVDEREDILSEWFRTPCRGHQIGKLFNKDEQCNLARKCGFNVPLSIIYNRYDDLNFKLLTFPLITKPLYSSKGSKGDIHICYTQEDLNSSLEAESQCESFIIQEYIEKEYEIDAIGVSIDEGIIMGGGVLKHRHWPKGIGAGAYGFFDKIDAFNIDLEPIQLFIKESNYHGPFSIELIHTKDGRNFFMEVNFRNEGLAYASTCAGANLHALYIDSNKFIDWAKFRKTYLMNYSIDFLYVKEKELSIWKWVRDLIRTRCFINICFSDLGPAFAYYKNKLCKNKTKMF